MTTKFLTKAEPSAQTAVTASAIWQPYTQMKLSPPPPMVRRAYDVFIELQDGRKIVDCISSWWVNVHGHGNRRIAEAIYRQALELEQVSLGPFTHEPAEKLAQQLIKLLPPELCHVFYSDNGATSVEVALKMAYQYWSNKGEPRSRFIAFESGYHGDTIGAMSIGQGCGLWKKFEPILFDADLVPFPATFEGDETAAAQEKASLEAFMHLVESNGDAYAAVVIEPLVQGFGGMRMCRPQFLSQLRSVCSDHNILLIYDEVMTGFGRTGDWFACTKSATVPDIICFSKGISGGFLPLAATVATEKIFAEFFSDDVQKTLVHAHSYGGNPLACAAALASLEIFHANPGCFENMEVEHRRLADRYLKNCKHLTNLRFCGTIMAVDITADSGATYFDSLDREGIELKQQFLDRGFLIRPIGNTIYLMPPYCITADILESAYVAIRETIDEL